MTVRKTAETEDRNMVFDFADLPLSLIREHLTEHDPHQEMSHWHDAVELVHVKDGEVHCHVNNSDFLLSEGDLCFINTGQLHRVYCETGEECTLDVLEVRPSIVSSAEDVYQKFVSPIVQDPAFTHIRVAGTQVATVKVVANLLEDLQERATQRMDGFELDVLGIVHLIFGRLYRIYQNGDKSAFAYDSDVAIQRRMVGYIYEHYRERVSLDDIAAAGGVSRSKCSAMFKKYSQASPVTFLNNYRLEVGATLLATTDEAVGEIAQSCGFTEQSYFNRLFTREYEQAPLAYRKAAKNANTPNKTTPTRRKQ